MNFFSMNADEQRELLTKLHYEELKSAYDIAKELRHIS